MPEPKKYRKKPVVIEAMEFTCSATLDPPILDWARAGGGTIRYYDGGGVCAEFLAIDTLEGTMRASVGDFVIRGVQGEFYPCKPDIFAATYEEVTDD